MAGQSVLGVGRDEFNDFHPTRMELTVANTDAQSSVEDLVFLIPEKIHHLHDSIQYHLRFTFLSRSLVFVQFRSSNTNNLDVTTLFSHDLPTAESLSVLVHSRSLYFSSIPKFCIMSETDAHLPAGLWE